MKQKAVLILGMHRSGTSAVARVLNFVGVHLGDNLFGPADDNIKGYWEHADLVQVHERILGAMRHKWSDVLPFPEKWWLDDKIQPFRKEIVRILERDFSEQELWGFKDPRLCRLLPLWHSILSELDCQEYFVVIFRNPVEVAASLARRNGFTIYKSALLWFRHISEVEAYTRGFPRIFVEYSQLLEDWERVIEKIDERMGLSLRKDVSSAKDEITEFLSSSLRHHWESYEAVVGRDDIPTFVVDSYKELVNASLDPDYDLTGGLSNCRRQFEEALRAFSPVIAVLEEVGISSEERTAWGRQVSERDAAIGQRDAQLAELRGQVSERDAAIGQRDVQLAELRSQVSERDAAIGQRDAQLAELRGQVSERDANLELLITKVEERDFQLGTLYHSKSWRITGPLRWGFARIRNVKNRIANFSDRATRGNWGSNAPPQCGRGNGPQ